MKNKIFIGGLILISFLYLFVRIYQLNNLIGFMSDQGIHLLETKEIFDSKKIRLVGPMVTSKSFMGKNFFIGANYYYVLGLVGLIGKWNPVTITVIFIFLELVSYIFFILILRRNFNRFRTLLIFIFISASPYLIVHSRFFWNPHLLIPLSILGLYFGEKYWLKRQMKYLFFMASCWGFGFACHYSAILWGLGVIYLLIKTKNIKKIKAYLMVLIGFGSGNLPWFIFEFRHSFYNTKTFFYVLTHSATAGELTSHYFVFSLLVLVVFGLLSILLKIGNKRKADIILISGLIGLYLIQLVIYGNYTFWSLNLGWNYPKQQKVVKLITDGGCPGNFNIATTVQGDTRAYNLRYLLNVKNCNPMGVEEYPNAEKLFLVAPKERPPKTETVWEVSSLGGFEIKKEEDLGNNIVFYELIKN